MMFVLDTNVVSELRKVRLGKADANVTAWTKTLMPRGTTRTENTARVS
jgi:hypothetical protein